MKVIVFTKLLQPWNAEKLIEFAKANGLAGFDLTVRPGFPVQPEDITRTLPPFVRQIKAAGLEVPMATVGGTAMPAADKLTETCWAACAEAGIKAIKLGYWNWKSTGGAEHYWEKVKAIRGELALYAKLGAKHGMKALYHTHSDAYYGLNEREKAIDAYRKGIDIDPSDAAAHFNLGELYYDLEELENAEKECMEAIRLDPSFTLGYLTMGNLCLDQERIADAINYFEIYLKKEKSPRAAEMVAEVKAVLEGLREEMKG